MAPKKDKKEAILEAMLDLVAEHGFHNAPMSLLAKRSGASPGVIYHYFPSKEDLIHALYLRVKTAKREIVLAGYSTDMPIKNAFLHFWTNAYLFYSTHLRETRFLDQYESSPFFRTAFHEHEEAIDPLVLHFRKTFRTKKTGCILKDLPLEAIHELSFGLALRLAKQAPNLKPAALKKVAEAAWDALIYR